MKKKVMACAALLAFCGASSLLCDTAAFAQAGMTTATPSLGATSSFGMVPGESVGPNGMPLGASPGVSAVPNGLTGTITVPNAGSGAACSTVATSPEGTFGSPTTYDGGGMAGGTTTPATAATPGSPSTPPGMSPSGLSTSSAISATSGISTTSGMLATSGLTGMCGSGAGSIAASSSPTTTTSSSSSGARAGIPLGSYEIGNLGVSAAPAVPTTSVSPFASTAGSNSPAPTMPAVAPSTGSSTTP
jgi:hypothetical protein